MKGPSRLNVNQHCYQIIAVCFLVLDFNKRTNGSTDLNLCFCFVKCVVIGLQSTGEARTLEALEEGGGELNDFVSTAK